MKLQIGDFSMDNINEKDGTECFGLFQESFNPIGLHVDGGFNLKDIIYKQTLLPLSNQGETIIFKNRYYGPSTSFVNNARDLEENSAENKINIDDDYLLAESTNIVNDYLNLNKKIILSKVD